MNAEKSLMVKPDVINDYREFRRTQPRKSILTSPSAETLAAQNKILEVNFAHARQLAQLFLASLGLQQSR